MSTNRDKKKDKEARKQHQLPKLADPDQSYFEEEDSIIAEEEAASLFISKESSEETTYTRASTRRDPESTPEFTTEDLEKAEAAGTVIRSQKREIAKLKKELLEAKMEGATREDIGSLLAKLDKLTTSQSKTQSDVDKILGEQSCLRDSQKEIRENQDKDMAKSSRLTPQYFYGEDCDDIHIFLDQFDTYAKSLKWKDTEKHQYLHMLLRGEAQSWYRGQDTATIKDWSSLRTAILNKYGPVDYLKKNRLLNRKQKPGESVSDYTKDMRKRIDRCELVGAERWQKYVDGLDDSIRIDVLRDNINTLDDAVESAKKFENIAVMKKKEMLKTIIDYNKLKSTEKEEKKNTEINAVEPNLPSSSVLKAVTGATQQLAEIQQSVSESINQIAQANATRAHQNNRQRFPQNMQYPPRKFNPRSQQFNPRFNHQNRQNTTWNRRNFDSRPSDVQGKSSQGPQQQYQQGAAMSKPWNPAIKCYNCGGNHLARNCFSKVSSNYFCQSCRVQHSANYPCPKSNTSFGKRSLNY